MSDQALQIDVQIIRKGKSVLRAINHRLRQQILGLIHQKGRMTVTDIYQELKIEQSVASMHLGILRVAMFLTRKRQGKNIFYSVNYERVKHVHLHCVNLVQQVAAQ